MAHQVHSIPWQTLADNLKYMHMSPHNNGSTNLYLRKNRQGQAKQLQHFVRGFSRAVAAYSIIERKKYNAEPTPPEQDEILISDDTMKKMSRTVRQYKTDSVRFSAGSHELDEVLTWNERTAKDFIAETSACEGDMHCGLRDVCELSKTLLLYGEMNTLLRLAIHPGIRFWKLWDEDQYANGWGFGLHKLLGTALQAYICLNVLFLKPELYDPESRETFIKRENVARRSTHKPEQYDYKLTAAYQRMLLNCTGIPYGVARFDVHTHPHREFFGIPRGMFRFEYSYYAFWRDRNLGIQTVADLAEDKFRGVHVAGQSDVGAVLSMLGQKGLPAELALQIMDLAEYVSVGRTTVRQDPLHVANAEELKKYLSYCWKLLVRIDMLVRANGCCLDWEAEVTDVLYALFGMESPKVSEIIEFTPYGNEPLDIARRCRKRVFVTW
ncbi:hypothetical protein N0V90_010621 [Kalmusia sp. IMI 367209]|nr:hypothetical protein N0V90_010621 [Kalmusia sp. IMI 367209]